MTSQTSSDRLRVTFSARQTTNRKTPLATNLSILKHALLLYSTQLTSSLAYSIAQHLIWACGPAIVAICRLF